MPIRWSINRGFTIAPNETQYGNNTAKNVLVTYDFAKCRGGPGEDHAPELGVAGSDPATPTNT